MTIGELVDAAEDGEVIWADANGLHHLKIYGRMAPPPVPPEDGA